MVSTMKKRGKHFKVLRTDRINFCFGGFQDSLTTNGRQNSSENKN